MPRKEKATQKNREPHPQTAALFRMQKATQGEQQKPPVGEIQALREMVEMLLHAVNSNTRTLGKMIDVQNSIVKAINERPETVYGDDEMGLSDIRIKLDFIEKILVDYLQINILRQGNRG